MKEWKGVKMATPFNWLTRKPVNLLTCQLVNLLTGQLAQLLNYPTRFVKTQEDECILVLFS